jgi:1-aminocyclopropane-1-carboxylate deaminase
MEVIDVSSYFHSNKRIDFILDDVHFGGYSGNKKWKLKYNLEACVQKGKQGILTFGGAFSNHIAASAQACYKAGLKSIGLIRGEEVNNKTLDQARKYGMELIFVSRNEFKEKDDLDYLKNLKYQFPDYFIVPEGGSNYQGLMGCIEFFKELKKYDSVVLSAGTGCTAAGACLAGIKDVHVFSALKGNWMKDEIIRHASQIDEGELENLNVYTDYHFGGYAKHTTELLAFMDAFFCSTKVQLEQVYTGKMVYGFCKELENRSFSRSQKIALIHTGGLQGLLEF